MQPVMLVVGTRPEGIKMMPVYYALKKANLPVFLCSTSQHTTMLSEVFTVFDVQPDIELGVMQQGQDLFHVTTQVLSGMRTLLKKIQPSIVLVQGDTTTVMATGLSAFYEHIPVGHIEAGLRTGDMYAPYPEEFNRVALSHICDYHFAPTPVAAANLLAEGKPRQKVFYTGNTVVDALRIVEEKISSRIISPRIDIERALAGATLEKQKKVLFTMHRRESFNGGIERILRALKEFALKNKDVFFVYPYHPNPHVTDAIEKVCLQNVENIFITKPVEYKDLVYLLIAVDFVATDSGGIQEEAVSLGKEVIVLREKSERMEGVWQGLATLVGTDEALFMQKLNQLAHRSVNVSQKTALYGDGYAAEKIVYILENALRQKEERSMYATTQSGIQLR